MESPESSDLGEIDDSYCSVRPYALVGGRVPKGTSGLLPVESLVQASASYSDRESLGKEFQSILDVTADDYLSVAEISAHVRLPVGVVRLMVSELADQNHVIVHGPNQDSAEDPTAALNVLESVLNGISAL